jgi:hypothetical protein
VYSALAILAAYTIAASWGVGLDTIKLAGELPDGLTRGTPFQETVIKIVSYSSVSGAVPFLLIFWGLLRPSELARSSEPSQTNRFRT